MSFWLGWVGLPQKLGADPREGKAACCLRTAQAAREIMGMPWPASEMREWYFQARAQQWELLRQQWEAFTAPIEKPEAGALIQIPNPVGFGLGVLPDAKTFLTVRHSGTLIAVPIAICPPLAFFRLNA